MPTRRHVLARALPVLALVAITLLPPAVARAESVLVFAAASTTDAVNAIIAAYGKNSRDTVRASYAASSALARQIASGAPANLFVSADQKWMDYVAQQKRIAGDSRRNLLRNTLLLIAPAASTATVKIAPGFDLAGVLGSGRLAVGDPDHVPAGVYARQALSKLGVWEAIAPRTARAQDVRAALALVERGETPLGIVYSTDAKATAKVRILDTFPRDSHPPIIYPAALIAGHDTPAARAFYAFLSSAEGSEIFGRFGFVVD